MNCAGVEGGRFREYRAIGLSVSRCLEAGRGGRCRRSPEPGEPLASVGGSTPGQSTDAPDSRVDASAAVSYVTS